MAPTRAKPCQYSFWTMPSKPELYTRTVFQCIIQCLIVLENGFTLYSFHGFPHTSMPKHTSMLKTIM